MDVEIERPAEPLHNGHGAPATIRHVVQARPTAQPSQHSAHGDGDDGAAQIVIPRQPIPQAMRQA